MEKNAKMLQTLEGLLDTSTLWRTSSDFGDRNVWNCKVLRYPSGAVDLVFCDYFVFVPDGWEKSFDWGRLAAVQPLAPDEIPEELVRVPGKRSSGSGLLSSINRAKSRVRKIALANNFRYFVTLTLDPDKVDRYDVDVIGRKLRNWLSHMVQKYGLRYVLVPEQHKDGALHFHGFFDDHIPVVDSGHVDKKGHKVYNLPSWTLGFTDAIEIYGEYCHAISYTIKYISKQQYTGRLMGRFYFSGGPLLEPEVEYLDLRLEDTGLSSHRILIPGCYGIDLVRFDSDGNKY